MILYVSYKMSQNVFEIKFPINIDNKIIDKLIKMSKEQDDNWKKMYM